jgi:hypothetical protein
MGEIKHSQAKDKAWLETPFGSMEPALHEHKWSSEKLLNQHKREAFSSIPASTNVRPDQIRSLQRTTADPETGEVFTAKLHASGTQAPAAAPSAPQLPEPLRGMEGLVFSPSRKQYRDNSGNVYDMNGKRVQ